MAMLAPAPVAFEARPRSAGSSKYGLDSFRRVTSSKSSGSSTPSSPKGTMSPGRLPGGFSRSGSNTPRDPIHVPRRNSDWIVFSDTDLTVPEPAVPEVRQKLVGEFPFLLEAEYALSKQKNVRVRPRLFSFPSAPAVLPSSSSDGSLHSGSGLQLSFTAAEERSVMRVKLVTETRTLQWRPISAVPVEDEAKEVVQLTPIESLPAVWSLPIDTRSTAKRALDKGSNTLTKRTFELVDMRSIASCGDCRGTSHSKCADCSGVDAATCFWCTGSGRRNGQVDAKKCSHCKGHGRTYCGTCQNTGKKACKTCDGSAKALMGLFVDVKMKVKEMPVISLASLRRSGSSTPNPAISGYSTPTGQQQHATEQPVEILANGGASIQALASARISQLVNDFIAAQDERVNPAQPVLATCEFERSTIHTVVVSASQNGAADLANTSPAGSVSAGSSGFLSVAMPRALKSPAPSMRSARSLFRRRSAIVSADEAAAHPQFWTFKVSSCPGIPPVQIA